MKKNFTFDDVLLVPQYSEIRSRAEIDISSEIDILNKRLLTLPVISSPMDTITESHMAITMADNGGLGIIHRYNSIEEQISEVKKVKDKTNNVAAAVGISGDYLERASELIKNGCNIICLDVAHGHHVLMKEALQTLRKKCGNMITVIAGNVATKEGFSDLNNWGADLIRVGIGSGSICSTRIKTGHGVPNLSAIKSCSKVKGSAKIIADGGIKTSGDIVKALAMGADFVMLGSMLSGTTETPGSVIEEGFNKKVKVYRGMASREAQINWKGSYNSLEGIATTVPYRGSVVDILQDIEKGIRSGFSYSGAKNLKELQNTAKFVFQSNASIIESDTHILMKSRS